MLGSLRKLDAYPRTLDEFRVRTSSGAVVSVVSMFFMLYLFFCEMSYYLKVEKIDHLVVDTSRSRNIKVTFDLTFPDMTCAALSVTANDISGTTQSAVDDHILKKRLNAQGMPISAPTRNTLGNTLTTEEQLLAKKKEHENATAQGQVVGEKPACLSCYGAEERKGQCCNTCAEVQEAYRKKGWAMTPDMDVEQCHKQNFVERLADQHGEGCHISGYIEVAKVAGSIVFGPGHGFQHAHLHVQDLMAFMTEKFNSSHIIHELSFGDPYPDAKNPLDGVARINPNVGSFQYFCKVVPTRYSYIDGRLLETNQFASTEHFRSIHPQSGRGLPTVTFNFDFSPISSVIEEREQALSGFLTSVCAIVGGVFTVMGLVDKLIHQLLGRRAVLGT